MGLYKAGKISGPVGTPDMMERRAKVALASTSELFTLLVDCLAPFSIPFNGSEAGIDSKC